MYSENNLTGLSDVQLLALVAEGKESRALPLLMERHLWIKRYFNNRFHNRTLEEDAWQETWTRVFRFLKKNNYLLIKDFRSWLCRIAHNIAVTILKRENHFSHNESDLRHAEEIGEEDANTGLSNYDTEKILALLSPRMRDVVRRKIVEGKTNRQIASELHISIGTSLSTFSKAMKKLKKNKSL